MVRGTKWILIVICLMLTLTAYGQSCDCPLSTECGACRDGISSLTFEYTGSSAVRVIVQDQQDELFDETVRPGQIFTVSTDHPSGKFPGGRLYIYLVYPIFPHAIVNTSCDDPIYIGSSFGSFKVVTGTSKGGGALCCAPGDRDDVKPTFSNCPSNISVAAESTTCSKKVNWTPPNVSDNCGDVTLTSSHSPGHTFPLGTTKVTYTATDAAGNTRNCSFNVVVKDESPPVFSGCRSSDLVVTVTNSCSSDASWKPPTATDQCSAVTLEGSHQPGESFPLGTTEVTYTATDEAGNESTCSFNVVIKDGNVPVFENCPSDISVRANVDEVVSVDWQEPSVSASCSEVQLEASHMPGDYFRSGVTEVVYEAKTNSGLTSSCSFSVIVSEDIMFEIVPIVTPDGNGENDDWKIGNIERYRDNQVTIVDRWGSVIFSAAGYNNEDVVWKGTNNSGSIVPTGTYFYTITVRSEAGVTEERGFIELVK